VKVTASATLTHNPCGEAYWASGLRENLTSRSYGEGLETDRALTQAPRQSFTRQRFHYTLKQGCTVERLQFEAAHTLQNALALYSIVAWRLLWLTYTAREQPQAPATELLPALELRVLEEATQAPVPTAREAIRALAQLGGFPTNPSAKEPGVKVLWRGLRRLEAMVEGWMLALQALPFMRQD
jgi:hypothetical protein